MKPHEAKRGASASNSLAEAPEGAKDYSVIWVKLADVKPSPEIYEEAVAL